jgi:hypothetical protein
MDAETISGTQAYLDMELEQAVWLNDGEKRNPQL